MITLANLSKLGNIDYGARMPFAAAAVEPSAPGHGKHLQGGRAELQRGTGAVLGHITPKSRTLPPLAAVATDRSSVSTRRAREVQRRPWGTGQ